MYNIQNKYLKKEPLTKKEYRQFSVMEGDGNRNGAASFTLLY